MKMGLKFNRNRVLNIFKVKCSNLTFHGLPSIARSKYYSIKLFWLVLFLGAISLCAYLVIQSVTDFFKYDVTSKQRLINEFPLKFPGVRVCNKDPFVTDESMKFLNDLFQNESGLFGLSNFTDDFQSKADNLNYLIINENENDNLIKTAINKLREEFDNISNNLIDESNQRILRCKFNANDCDNEITYDFDSSTGFCLTFNFNKPYSDLLNIGEIFGLELILFVGKSKKYNYLTSSYRSVVYINNQSFSNKKFNAIDISPGKETKIVYSKTFREKQRSPYSDCLISSIEDLKTFNSQYIRYILNENQSYNSFECKVDCLQKEFLDKCDCINDNFDCITCDFNTSICDSISDLDCMKTIDQRITIDHKCQAECPIECDTQTLSFRVTASDYPTESEKQRLIKSSNVLRQFMKNGETIEDKVLKIKIFTESFYYEYVSESPSVIVSNLLASIGGNLGLCLGVSILSFFEIVEFFIELVLYIMENRKINDLDSKK